MKIEFTIKYKLNKSKKASEVINKISTLAKTGDIKDEELEIKIEFKEAEKIEIYPTITLEKNESIDIRAEKFIADYLKELDFDKDLIVNNMELKTDTF